MLRIHFYALSGRTPWWLRAIWWPRPRYSHVCVEWSGFVHDLPATGPSGVYIASAFLRDAPSLVSYDVEAVLTGTEAAAIINRYNGAVVDRLGVVRWHLGSRRHRPRSCAGLVCSWLRIGTLRESWQAVTADELHERIEHAVSTGDAKRSTGPAG